MKVVWLLIGLSCTQLGFGTEYTACRDGKAFWSNKYGFRDEARDWICRLRPDVANPRCIAAQDFFCEGAKKGPHDVPNGGWAWFLAFVEGVEGPVRCTCGCFHPETEILSFFGALSIAELLERSRTEPVRVLRRNSVDDPGDFVLSQSMRAPNFTAGPEEKPLYHLYLDNGRELLLTSKHPVLVRRAGQLALIRAEGLSLSDQLFDEQGHPVALEELGTERLDKSQKVINFSAGDRDPLAHLIVANSIQVGDNYLQQHLDILHGRLKNRGFVGKAPPEGRLQ